MTEGYEYEAERQLLEALYTDEQMPDEEPLLMQSQVRAANRALWRGFRGMRYVVLCICGHIRAGTHAARAAHML